MYFYLCYVVYDKCYAAYDKFDMLEEICFDP